jgi:ubiquinone/menaquinone biosynthesis C-methylase UbiE
MLPVYWEHGLRCVGVDVSEDMVRHAKAAYPGITVHVGDAGALPYRDAAFDLLVCWGTFETLDDQRRCLREFARVLKAGGRMLITGKNRDYRPDDHEAAIAEQRASEKGHPNYFTPYEEFLAWAQELRLVPYEEYFFEYRGDLSRARCFLVRPARFYEYCVLLRR